MTCDSYYFNIVTMNLQKEYTLLITKQQDVMMMHLRKEQNKFLCMSLLPARVKTTQSKTKSLE